MLPEPPELVGSPRAVYVGDVRSSRGLFDMLDALELAPGWRLDMVGPVAETDRRALKARLARDPCLAGRITWHGRLPPSRAWQVARGAWVGLCLLRDTPAFHDAVPSKLYEYLAAGLVPLASDLPRQRGLLVDSRCGVVVGDATEAAFALRRFAADPAEHLAERARGLAWARGRAAGPTAYDLAAGQILGLAGAR